jgi:hypothetical protein
VTADPRYRKVNMVAARLAQPKSLAGQIDALLARADEVIE